MGTKHKDDVLGPKDTLFYEFKAKRIITPAQLKASFTTPITLIPATLNCLTVPRFVIVQKDAGTAYTANGNANLRISEPTGGIIFQNLPIALFTTTAATFSVTRHGTTFGISSASSPGILSQPVTLKPDVADLGAPGTGNLIINISWNVIPTNPDWF